MRRSKKRKLDPTRKYREIKFWTDARVYDMHSAIAGPNSLVETYEQMVEREFIRRLKKMGLEIPPISEKTC